MEAVCSLYRARRSTYIRLISADSREYNNENSYFIIFQNVSKIKLSEISYPFQICGFEILDYSSRGYQNDSRFFVNDYEDGKLSFYCEDFEILPANR